MAWKFLVCVLSRTASATGGLYEPDGRAQWDYGGHARTTDVSSIIQRRLDGLGWEHRILATHRRPYLPDNSPFSSDLIGPQVLSTRTEGCGWENVSTSSRRPSEEERGVTVEGLEMSVSTGFHCHGATRHVALHLTAQCRLRERTTTE